MSRLAIVDSGGANIASLLFAFERLGVTAELTTKAETIRTAPRVVLPGVGAAGDAMQRLRDAQLIDVVRELRQPVLGICLGMQLLCEASEEEDVECLGIVPGIARRLTVSEGLAVPNMGWCATHPLRAHPVLPATDQGSRFYFLHSSARPGGAATIATALHTQECAAAIARDNFFAAQFHPERSSQAGATLLANCLQWQA